MTNSRRSPKTNTFNIGDSVTYTCPWTGYIENGVIVINILNSSIASESGIMVGDVILRVGDMEINSVSEFRNSLKDLKEEESVLFLIKRRGGSIFIPLEIN